MNILCLNNNFYGSYESSQVFHRELATAFRNIGANVFEVQDLETAEKLCRQVALNFSISFGKYFYKADDFLYNKYRLPHYQWVSDNPLKMNLDTRSHFITYIFIDEEYIDMIPSPANKCLILPLGFSEENFLPFNAKSTGILIPCKIRNLNALWQNIKDSRVYHFVKDFLFDYNLDDSYIAALSEFLRQKELQGTETANWIFRLSNEFLRIQKRLTVINSLSDFNIYVVSDDCQNPLHNPGRVKFLPLIKYSHLIEAMRNFRFIINIDPNYHACIHDRFVRSVGSGCVCLTNKNLVMQRWNEHTYTFDGEQDINTLIHQVAADIERVFANQFNCIKKFTWEKSAEKIIANYLSGAREDRYEL